MNNTSTALYGQAENNLSLQASLDKVKTSALLEGAVGLFYSPRSCAVGRMKASGEIETLRKVNNEWSVKPLGLASVFEAKLFTQSAELSWLNNSTDVGGRTVLVTPDKTEKTFFEQSLEMPDIYDVLPQSYLVWGQYDSDSERVPIENWTIVSTSQVGQLAVPVTAQANRGFASLKTQEYLASDRHGNAYVKYERLLNLSWETKGEN